MRDENQLHAAVVELVAAGGRGDQVFHGPELVSRRRRRPGRHLQLRHQARRLPRATRQGQLDPGGDRLGSDLEVPVLHPARRRQLQGEFYSIAVTNGRQQADTGTKMIHLGANTRSRIISKGISAGRSSNTYRGLVARHTQGQGRAQLHPVRQPADRQGLRRPHRALRRGQERPQRLRARGHHHAPLRRPAVLLPEPRPLDRGERSPCSSMASSATCCRNSPWSSPWRRRSWWR